MLSMAYGDDQRGGLQAHRPEVCYPAQGFKLGKVEDGSLSTSFGNIEVRRLDDEHSATATSPSPTGSPWAIA